MPLSLRGVTYLRLTQLLSPLCTLTALGRGQVPVSRRLQAEPTPPARPAPSGKSQGLWALQGAWGIRHPATFRGGSRRQAKQQLWGVPSVQECLSLG